MPLSTYSLLSYSGINSRVANMHSSSLQPCLPILRLKHRQMKDQLQLLYGRRPAAARPVYHPIAVTTQRLHMAKICEAFGGMACVKMMQRKVGEWSAGASCLLFATIAAASLLLFNSDSGSLASAAPEQEVEAVKIAAVNAWTVVKDTYVDGTFNHQNWESRLQQTLTEIADVDSKEKAYTKLQDMLATLDDPYTRVITQKEFESFQISKDGSVEGVGLLLGSDQGSGRLYVLSPVKGGPASRAGVLSGDELVQIDGQTIKGMNGEEAAARLRGKVGTFVTLKLRRRQDTRAADNIHAVGMPDIKIKLLRERIVLSPVSMAILPLTLPDGHATKTGYIHLSTFSESAAPEMEKAIREMEQEGVTSYILDLRNNPVSIFCNANTCRSLFSELVTIEQGGLVRAGLEVAEMWLHSNETVVNIVDRQGNMESIRLESDSHPLTDQPLILLLNGNSASASEILAGALRDNERAMLVGQRSFGKGKIQSVTELEDGSGLFVTIAKYLSPSLHEIEQRGISPDVDCPDPDRHHPYESANITMDPCVLAAQQQLGILSMIYFVH